HAFETITAITVMAMQLSQLLTGTEPVSMHGQRNVLQNQIGHGRLTTALYGAGCQWCTDGYGLGGKNAQQAVLFGGKTGQVTQFLRLNKKGSALCLHRELPLMVMLMPAESTQHLCRRKQLP